MPQNGIEPLTHRVSIYCSTIELLRLYWNKRIRTLTCSRQKRMPSRLAIFQKDFYLLIIGLEPIPHKEQILNLSCLPISPNKHVYIYIINIFREKRDSNPRLPARQTGTLPAELFPLK